MAGEHRHRHRRAALDRRCAATGLSDHPELGLRRLDGRVRSGAPHRVRAVGRGPGRRDGPPNLVDDHHVRPDRNVGTVLVAGVPGTEQRVDRVGAVGSSAGLLRRQSADPQCDTAANPARGAVARRELSEHDGDELRCHRRSAQCRHPHLLHRTGDALPDRHHRTVRHAVGGDQAAGHSAGQVRSTRRITFGVRGFRVPRYPEGAAGVVRRRHHRHGVRDASGAVPADRPRQFRGPGLGWAGAGHAVRGDVRGSGARWSVLRLATARAASRPCGVDLHRRLGRGDDRIRARRRCGDRRSDDGCPVVRTGVSGARWRCRHDLGGVPQHDAADGGDRRDARPTARRLHRRRRGRAPDRRCSARRGSGLGGDGRGRRRRWCAGGHRCLDRSPRATGIHSLPSGRNRR